MNVFGLSARIVEKCENDHGYLAVEVKHEEKIIEIARDYTTKLSRSRKHLLNIVQHLNNSHTQLIAAGWQLLLGAAMLEDADPYDQYSVPGDVESRVTLICIDGTALYYKAGYHEPPGRPSTISHWAALAPCFQDNLYEAITIVSYDDDEEDNKKSQCQCGNFHCSCDPRQPYELSLEEKNKLTLAKAAMNADGWKETMFFPGDSEHKEEERAFSKTHEGTFTFMVFAFCAIDCAAMPNCTGVFIREGLQKLPKAAPEAWWTKITAKAEGGKLYILTREDVAY